jgi:hypothetical protein
VSDFFERKVIEAKSHGDQVLAAMRDQSTFSALLPEAYVSVLFEFALVGISVVSEVSAGRRTQPIARKTARMLLERLGKRKCNDLCCALIALRELLYAPE